jgi:prepilin-type N-terminal cleavage/methylation domain-containing protein
MKTRHGFTLTDLLVAVAVLAVCAALMLPAASGARLRLPWARAREEARRIRCRNNLNQMAKGMATYLNEHGDNRFYPCPLGRTVNPKNYNGAEWLASMYWTGVLPDPGVFLCPSTRDTNNDGRDLGTERAVAKRFGTQTVSYAAMHYKSMTDQKGAFIYRAIRDDFPPNMPMGSDDTQGTINHGKATNGGMAVLYFDSHVEFKTHTEIDLVRGVGQQGDPRPLLYLLRN